MHVAWYVVVEMKGEKGEVEEKRNTSCLVVDPEM
jgi:hypothetical protein